MTPHRTALHNGAAPPLPTLSILFTLCASLPIPSPPFWRSVFLFTPAAATSASSVTSRSPIGSSDLLPTHDELRTRSEVTPSLSNRATLVAWSPNVHGAPQNGSVTAQDSATSLTSRGINLAPTESGNDVRSSVQSAVPASVQNAVPSPSPNFISEFEEMHVDAVPMSNMQTASRSSTNVAANLVDFFSNAMPCMVSNFSHGMVSSVEELDPDVETLDRAGSVPNPPSDVASYVDDIEMVDGIEHPRMLSGDRESPFIYLASLSTKWAAMKEKASSVQGKVKDPRSRNMEQCIWS